MNADTRRMMLAFEQKLREINREIVNPMIDSLHIDGIEPVMLMVAKARGQYLQALISLAEDTSGEVPDDAQIKELAKSKIRYDQLVAASQALETAIQRGYLDVSCD